MTYSVYSLNFSNLFPQQSEYLMTITLYFLLSITWTLLSMVWFVVCNHYISKAEMPKSLGTFSGLLQSGFVCCFSPASNENKKVALQGTVVQNDELKKPADEQHAQATSPQERKCSFCQNPFASCCRRSARVENIETKKHAIVEDAERTTTNPTEVDSNGKAVFVNMREPVSGEKPKCHFCDKCEPCLADFNKAKAKDKSKKETESKCSALNYFVFLCVFLCMLIANMVLWLSMAS